MEKLSLNATPEELAEMDFSELEGKVIDYIHSSTSIRKATPAIIDFNIGITITCAKDKTHNVCCSHGPNSPEKSRHRPHYYKDHFIYTVNAAIDGTHDVEIGRDLLEPDLQGFGQISCAFNQ